MPGPDFPTGGVIVEPRENIAEAYRTGRGGFRVRATWEIEAQPRGGYLIVVTEIPFGVQKSRLIEKIAELVMAKKLPHLADIRDESAEEIRLVLEPKSRNVDAEILMASLFKYTDLETRVPLNMNVLRDGKVPVVMGLGEVLNAWLAHRRVVLQRASRHRLEKIARRLEILGGYLVAFLNLDEVIRIIRFEDEPKRELMKSFDLTETQAEAILNMRLRSLRKLEEIELRKEFSALTKEAAKLDELLASEAQQWASIAGDIREVRKQFGQDTEIGRRRTQFGDVPSIDIDIDEAMIEREPVTVVLSQKGWIRALKGHIEDTATLTFKKDDGPGFVLHAQTTDKLLLLATGGRFFTIGVGGLPGGRGAGEPLRMMVDLDETEAVVTVMIHQPGARLLVAATSGHGFVVSHDALLANTRKGRQVINVSGTTEACLAVPAQGDMLAVIGDNRKLLIYPLAEVNEMTRGRGVRLQRYRDGGLADARVFSADDGLTWQDTSGRTWSVSEIDAWRGARAQAGRLPPKGFPKANRFSPK